MTHEPGRATIDIDWDAATAAGAPKSPVVKIRSDEALRVRIRGFNFLHYGLTLDVSERTIEAYKLIEGLWSEVLRLPVFLAEVRAGTAAAPESFEAALAVWLENIEAGRAVARRAGDFHPQDVGLSTGQTGLLMQLGADATATMTSLAKARGEAQRRLNAQMSLERWLQFKQTEEVHERVRAGLEQVELAASLARDGKVQAIGTRKAGTLLTLTARARNSANGNDVGQVGPLSVFVESRHPLQFHAGFSYTKREQVDFEKVRTLAGADMFLKVTGPGSDTGVTAFLTYDLARWGGSRAGAVGLSLGTDVDSPGDKIFLGVSARFLRRFVVSGGGVSALGKEGEDPIASQVAERLGAPQLYASFARAREWHGFAAVSFSVLP